MQLIEFIPLYMERVWGGRTLESKLDRTLPAGKKIGESWEIVDRTDYQSVVADGPLAGLTLRELLLNSTSELLGPGGDPQKPFPILVKWLDCRERLSLQVHPPKDIAPDLNGEPKTENWYIADADADASITVGLQQGVTREEFENALAENRIEGCLKLLPTTSGNSILIKSGCVHAINAGNLILEIQQNSDTTYRVHDWNRVGLDGTPRQLHLREALQSINFGEPQPKLIEADTDETVLVDCDEFRIRKFNLIPEDSPVLFLSNEQPRLLHVVSGKLRDQVSGQTLTRSKNYLQPFVSEVSLIAETEATLLVTDQFLAQS